MVVEHVCNRMIETRCCSSFYCLVSAEKAAILRLCKVDRNRKLQRNTDIEENGQRWESYSFKDRMVCDNFLVSVVDSNHLNNFPMIGRPERLHGHWFAASLYA